MRGETLPMPNSSSSSSSLSSVLAPHLDIKDADGAVQRCNEVWVLLRPHDVPHVETEALDFLLDIACVRRFWAGREERGAA